MKSTNKKAADMEKPCTKCGEVKAVHEFSYRVSGRPHSWCTDCRNAYKREDRARKKMGIVKKVFAGLPSYGTNETIENFEELNSIF